MINSELCYLSKTWIVNYSMRRYLTLPLPLSWQYGIAILNPAYVVVLDLNFLLLYYSLEQW